MTLNIDGAAKGNPGEAGAGGLIRGHRGEVHKVFALNCGICTSTKAELMAVLKGLLVTWEGVTGGWKWVWILRLWFECW